MSRLWICLSLFAVASFLQSSASSEGSGKGVSVKCNETREVTAGETVTLNCTLHFNVDETCQGVFYSWSYSHGIICNSSVTKSKCDWDAQTYVSLTISNVMEEENYTVYIRTVCGEDKSSPIKVQVKQNFDCTGRTLSLEQKTTCHIAPEWIIFSSSLILILIAIGILYFLSQTDRGRQSNVAEKTYEHLV